MLYLNFQQLNIYIYVCVCVYARACEPLNITSFDNAQIVRMCVSNNFFLHKCCLSNSHDNNRN